MKILVTGAGGFIGRKLVKFLGPHAEIITHRFDEDGDIKKYRFDFGDSSGGQPQDWEQEESEAWHRYENDGKFIASVHVQDSRGNWRNGNDDCRVEIEVNDKPKVLSATVTRLPKTGAPLGIVFGLTSLSGIGAYLYKRFKLVS